VLAHPSLQRVGASLSTEAALMNTGRPVLLVPQHPPSQIGSSIAVAWNGTAESAGAVGETKAFLRGARKVTILTVDEPGTEYSDPEGLRRFLSLHGVSARTHRVRSRAGEALLHAAEQAGANLLVMAAYSHSRLRQLVFGGVTSHMLQSANIPLLMVH
jgi:nucleotide-binding universal stress UspA family protein